MGRNFRNGFSPNTKNINPRRILAIIVTIFMCALAPFIKKDDFESVRGLLEELFPLLSKADAQWSQYRGTPRSSEWGRVQCVAYWQGSLGRSSRPPRRREL